MNNKKIISIFIFCLIAGLIYKNYYSKKSKASLDKIEIANHETNGTISTSETNLSAEEKALAVIQADGDKELAAMQLQNTKIEACLKKIALTKNKKFDYYNNEPNPDLQKNSLIGQWFSDKKPAEPKINSTNSNSEKFYYALAKSGFLSSSSSKYNFKYDDKIAIELLTEVSQSDPKNSAPLSFLCMILEKNKKSEQLISCLDQLKKTEYFDSYFKGITTNYLKNANDVVDLFSIFNGVIYHLAIPDYIALKDFIVKNKLLNITDQLVVDASLTKNVDDLYDYIAIEYSTGAFAYRTITKDKTKYPHHRDIMKEKSVNSFHTELTSLGIICYEKGLEQAFEKIKNKYN